MSTKPMFELPTWSPQAVESIRELYPRKINKKAELKKIEDALTRIVNGEIDGNPRTPEQAILYLRERPTSHVSRLPGGKSSTSRTRPRSTTSGGICSTAKR